MHELGNGLVPLDALFGPRLHDRLANATVPERFALLDELFLARLDDAVSPVPSITRALARLRASEGRVPIAALSDELGCSRRHLTAHFREQVGVAPKLFARILRFQKAVALMDDEPSWAAIAQGAGYYDQAHLIRDFRQFAGASPTEFTRLRLPDGGGVRDAL
jgi:AraC-like DNA-binding protein